MNTFQMILIGFQLDSTLIGKIWQSIVSAGNYRKMQACWNITVIFAKLQCQLQNSRETYSQELFPRYSPLKVEDVRRRERNVSVKRGLAAIYRA